jgi:hypothetical protein
MPSAKNLCARLVREVSGLKVGDYTKLTKSHGVNSYQRKSGDTMTPLWLDA